MGAELSDSRIEPRRKVGVDLMAWEVGTFKHKIGTYVPTGADCNVYPWNPGLMTRETRHRERSGSLWSYRHYQYPTFTLHFVDVGSTCVHFMGTLLVYGTDGFHYDYAGFRYHVMPPENFRWAPQADGPDIWSFELPLEATEAGTLRLMAK